MSFVYLHVHSEHSWLDGACIIEELVQRAEQLKTLALEIGDKLIDTYHEENAKQIRTHRE